LELSVFMTGGLIIAERRTACEAAAAALPPLLL
jgi:hypothetical protein